MATAWARPTTLAGTGSFVNGNDVTAYALFVEHHEQSQVVWNGQNGTDIFFQSEMPYDPPNHAAWPASPRMDIHPIGRASSSIDLRTRFLNGSGAIESVINGTGGPVNSMAPGRGDVVSYP